MPKHKPKPILRAALDDYLHHTYPGLDIPEIQRKEVEQAFWVGARCMLDAEMKAAELSDEEAAQVMIALEDEIRGAIFARKLELMNPARG